MKQNSRFALQVYLLPDNLSCTSMMSLETAVQISFYFFIGGRVANMFYLGPNRWPFYYHHFRAGASVLSQQ